MTTTELERPQVRAVAKWVRISPRKARLVIDHIRGRTVPEARTVLAFTQRAAAREIEKVLRSAVANAEANHELVGDDLYVSEALVDDGLIIKRFKPQARGRVARIKKRTCHITIKVSPVDGARRAPRATVVEPEVEEVEEAPTTESVGALTPEEQKAAAKPRRSRAKPKAEPEAAEPEAETETVEAEAEVAEPAAQAEPEAAGEDKKATPKRRAPRVRRKKKEEETDT